MNTSLSPILFASVSIALAASTIGFGGGCTTAVNNTPDAGQVEDDSGIPDAAAPEAGPIPQNGPPCQLAYEAIPNPSLGFGEKIRLGTYEQKEAWTTKATAIATDTIAALALPAGDVTTAVKPGGFLRSTNPSFQSRAKLDLKGCDRFAAGVGYVFEQESVLVSRYGVGDVGYGNVRFPTGALTGASAQAFFLHAATTNDGLGGGYSGVDDDMVFINLRSPTGAPYSQLDDTAYLTALKGAAASYKTVTVTFAEEGKSDAHLVANSWSGKKEGEDYLTAFTAEPSVVSTLKSLRMRFETEAKAAAAALP